MTARAEDKHHRQYPAKYCDQVAMGATCLVACAGAARDLVGLPGVWATVKYLTAVSPPDEKLVKRHARCAMPLVVMVNMTVTVQQ